MRAFTRAMLAAPLLALACAVDTAVETTAGTSTGSTGSTTGEPTTTGEPPTTGGSSTGGSALACAPSCAETWEFAGELRIEADTDLSQYACLGRVTGIMEVQGPHSAEALAVFDSLGEVGDFRVIDNPVLTDLSPFACLRETSAVGLTNLPALSDATLPSLGSLARLSIRNTGLPALPSFAPEFAGLGSLDLTDNLALADLTSASAWIRVGAPKLHLERDPALTSMAPLANFITGDDVDLSLRFLPGLESLAGLEGVRSGTILLQDLKKVPSLAPLSGLVKADSVQLYGLPAIPSLAGLGNLLETKFLTIGGCSEDPEAGLHGLKDLAGLDNLHTAQYLSISNSDGLVDLGGAPALNKVVALAVIDNAGLTQDDVDELLAQVPDAQTCFGGWDSCDCASPPHI